MIIKHYELYLRTHELYTGTRRHDVYTISMPTGARLLHVFGRHLVSTPMWDLRLCAEVSLGAPEEARSFRLFEEDEEFNGFETYVGTVIFKDYVGHVYEVPG